MEAGASQTGINQQLGNRIQGDAFHAADRPHGRAFAEHVEDTNAGFRGQMNFYA
jgi:hypothetical protein